LFIAGRFPLNLHLAPILIVFLRARWCGSMGALTLSKSSNFEVQDPSSLESHIDLQVSPLWAAVLAFKCCKLLVLPSCDTFLLSRCVQAHHILHLNCRLSNPYRS